MAKSVRLRRDTLLPDHIGLTAGGAPIEDVPRPENYSHHTERDDDAAGISTISAARSPR